MKVKYTPYVSGGVSMTFTGDTAAHVAEQVLQNRYMQEALGLSGCAGHRIHGASLSKAEKTLRGLTRKLIIDWQAMETLPQTSQGKTNPILPKTVYLEHGKDDSPEVEWIWKDAGSGQLVAEER